MVLRQEFSRDDDGNDGQVDCIIVRDQIESTGQQPSKPKDGSYLLFD